MLDWTEAQLTWTNLKPRFQKQFATQTDDKQIIVGLSNLAKLACQEVKIADIPIQPNILWGSHTLPPLP
jgi:hypothetical protein